MDSLKGLKRRNKGFENCFFIFSIRRPFLKKVFFVLCLAGTLNVNAQPDSLGFFEPSPVYSHQRVKLLTYTAAAMYPLSMYWLYTQWYEDYQQTTFHAFNDNGEWLQMDKCGHVYTSYTIGKAGMRAFEWAGVNSKKAVWYGAGIGFVFQTSFEIYDGFSSQWGFSFSDIAANALGSAILISQQYSWGEQRLTLKYSFHQTNYSNYRPEALGSTLQESAVKDYNGQTYWLSINPHSFMSSNSWFPRWISISLGYGAEGMLGGYSNPESDGGNLYPYFERYRQYYLSIDFDLSRIQTRSKLLSGIFKAINLIKLPAPTIEFNSHHKTKFYAFYF